MQAHMYMHSFSLPLFPISIYALHIAIVIKYFSCFLLEYIFLYTLLIQDLKLD